MKRRFTQIFIAFIFLFITAKSFSQNNFIMFWEPNIILNYNVSEAYKHQFEIKERIILYHEEDFSFTVRQVDFWHFSTLKLKNNNSIGLGLMYRFGEVFDETRPDEFRLVEELKISSKFGHRFRTEQRITAEKTRFRFRYQFGLYFPLKNEKTYISTSLEKLLTAASEELPQYDVRFTPQIGWFLSEKITLQTGLEYRIENYTHNSLHVLFLLSSCIIKL